jgi:hypothetical protein
MDVPAIDVVFRHPQTARPLDARGLSEIGMTGVGAALVRSTTSPASMSANYRPRSTRCCRPVNRVLVIIGMFAIEEVGIGQTEIDEAAEKPLGLNDRSFCVRRYQ